MQDFCGLTRATLEDFKKSLPTTGVLIELQDQPILPANCPGRGEHLICSRWWLVALLFGGAVESFLRSMAKKTVLP